MPPIQPPAGWDEQRIKRVLEHYEGQTEEESIAEDEAAYADTKFTFLQVPIDLVPQVQSMIDAHQPR